MFPRAAPDHPHLYPAPAQWGPLDPGGLPSCPGCRVTNHLPVVLTLGAFSAGLIKRSVIFGKKEDRSPNLSSQNS